MWQDYVLAGGSAVFTVALLPSLFNRRTEMPRVTSIMTSSILATFAAVHVNMGMPLVASMNVAGATVWGLIALLRPIRLPDPSARDAAL